MSGNKVVEIKLFGNTIQLGSISNGDMIIDKRFDPSDATQDVDCESTSYDQSFLCSKQGENRGDENSSTTEPVITRQEEELSSTLGLEESKTTTCLSTITENPKTPSNDKDCSSQYLSRKEDHSDQTSSTNSQDQNPPKKPDKISPCPRCSSMNTKFCYFNNYNANQPRHFCKNCQRYWTAGGTMRNVPVGSGRRKNKNSPDFHHLHHLAIHNGEPPSAKLPNNPSNGFTRPEMNHIPFPTLCLTFGNGNGVSEGERNSQGFQNSLWHYSWNQIAWKSATFNVLGKHSREEIMSSGSNAANDVPTEDKRSSNCERGFFRGLHRTQGADHDHERNNQPRDQESSMILEANPAALCRSVSFHEIAQLGL